MDIEVDSDTNEVTAKRPIRRSGNSLVVSIPPEILRAAGFSLGDEVEVCRATGERSIQLRAQEDSSNSEQ